MLIPLLLPVISNLGLANQSFRTAHTFRPHSTGFHWAAGYGARCQVPRLRHSNGKDESGSLGSLDFDCSHKGGRCSSNKIQSWSECEWDVGRYTREAFVSIPINEDPWWVAVNVSRGGTEENCVQATCIDLLQNGKHYWLRKCWRYEIEIESRTQIMSEFQKSLKFISIKFIRKMGEMRKKGRNVCVNTSFQSIALKRVWDLRVNLLNAYFLNILLIHPTNTYDIGKRE